MRQYEDHLETAISAMLWIILILTGLGLYQYKRVMMLERQINELQFRRQRFEVDGINYLDDKYGHRWMIPDSGRCELVW